MTRKRFDRGSGARAERRGGVDAEEGLDVESGDEGSAGADHAMREVRRSCEVGRVTLRMISNAIKHRIWSRAPERQAMCVAVGDGTDVDVATAR